jgi:hypothetical protein
MVSGGQRSYLQEEAMSEFMLVMVLIFLALSNSSAPVKVTTERAQEIVREVRYVEDARTELCFAIVKSNTVMMTTVPCDAVREHLGK